MLILQSKFNIYYYADKGSLAASEKPKLVFGDAGWDSIRIHNKIAAIIIENGYRYKIDEIIGLSLIFIKGLRQVILTYP